MLEEAGRIGAKMLRAAGKEGERVRDRVSRAPPREKGAVRQKTPADFRPLAGLPVKEGGNSVGLLGRRGRRCVFISVIKKVVARVMSDSETEL